MAASGKPSAFAQRLIGWQRRHGRHELPWQGQPADPYRVWLSEIMLQQTQVTTVIDYFNRFIKRFPNLQALAGATEQEVLALWSGLGYYRRARNLHACAREIALNRAGRFPGSAQALAALPGIGPSTAAAIASTVFGERAAILDGNVKRVLARLTCAEQPWGSPALERALWKQADDRLPKHSSDMPAYTQTIMDLGALICRPKAPQCSRCPVASDCQAYRRGEVDRYPVPKTKRAVPQRQLYWAVCLNAQSVWLMQQPSAGIWPSLWLPWTIDPDALPRDWDKTITALQHVIEVRHSLTHYRMLISVAMLRHDGRKAPAGAPKGLKPFGWPEALSLPLPAPVKRLLARLYPVARATDGGLRRSKPV